MLWGRSLPERRLRDVVSGEPTVQQIDVVGTVLVLSRNDRKRRNLSLVELIRLIEARFRIQFGAE